jgi:chromate reductase, NAD(P)H dehydrogenase (quinone)
MSETKLHVLALAGSLRCDSINRKLLYAAAKCAPDNVLITVYDELGALPMFNEDLEADGGPAAVQHLRDAVRRADALILATPEYNHSMPGVLKNAIDWLSRSGPDEVLVGKPVLAMGASTGPWGTRLAQAALRQVLFSTQALVMPKPALHLRSAQSLFDANGDLCDEATRKALQQLMLDFVLWIVQMKAMAINSREG